MLCIKSKTSLHSFTMKHWFWMAYQINIR